MKEIFIYFAEYHISLTSKTSQIVPSVDFHLMLIVSPTFIFLANRSKGMIAFICIYILSKPGLTARLFTPSGSFTTS